MLRIVPSGQKITVAHLETHPKCPECIVPMWRVETIRHPSGDQNSRKTNMSAQRAVRSPHKPRATSVDEAAALSFKQDPPGHLLDAQNN